jgi:hypothetical protein
MLNPEFDPLRSLEQLEHNQIALNQNQLSQSEAMKQIVNEINRINERLDLLQRGLEAANKANELLLNNMMENMKSQYMEPGRH